MTCRQLTSVCCQRIQQTRARDRTALANEEAEAGVRTPAGEGDDPPPVWGTDRLEVSTDSIGKITPKLFFLITRLNLFHPLDPVLCRPQTSGLFL